MHIKLHLNQIHELKNKEYPYSVIDYPTFKKINHEDTKARRFKKMNKSYLKIIAD